MNLLSEVLSYTAGIIHFTAFIIYGACILKKTVKPCLATWLIWAYTCLLTLLSYDYIAKDWLKETVALSDSVGCLAVFLLCIGRHTFKKPDSAIFIGIFVVDVATSICWWIYGGSLAIYVILQLSDMFSVIPSCRSAWENPKNEKLIVWIMWTVGYAISGVVVILRWQCFWDIVYQANFIVIHGAVAAVLIIKIARQKRNN